MKFLKCKDLFSTCKAPFSYRFYLFLFLMLNFIFSLCFWEIWLYHGIKPKVKNLIAWSAVFIMVLLLIFKFRGVSIYMYINRSYCFVWLVFDFMNLCNFVFNIFVIFNKWHISLPRRRWFSFYSTNAMLRLEKGFIRFVDNIY